MLRQVYLTTLTIRAKVEPVKVGIDLYSKLINRAQDANMIIVEML